MKSLYALVTNQCNLSCPHCDVKRQRDTYDRDRFISQLDKFDGNIILFGGEPTLFPDRLADIFLSSPSINRKISSISTNMMNVDDKILTIIGLIRHVSTSWNPNRFNDHEYQTWLDNINILGTKLPDVKLGILITMTDDLISSYPPEIFNKVISKWNPNVIKHIRFEHYVSESNAEDYFRICDEWLCEIYKAWNSPIPMYNVSQVDDWYFDCTDTWTLQPDGTMHNGCPHTVDIHVPDKCYTCEKVNVCRPCRLQKYCSYPKKFIDLVKSRKGD